ncbi:unnamed protein product [Paramecium octaurelia]|uniref:EF-hand domain-containing protein n=1 Tax=Paramecium octaurelia TaxID=43137 RepID=A0A8S1V1V3_PAROT|nr:unnamed protein product [Paramecium octaurelia]
MRPYTSTPQIQHREQAQVNNPFIQLKSAIEFRQNVQHYKPKFYVTKAHQDSNEQFLSSKTRDPPNSREFKKTIPITMVQDKERLYEELNKTKQMCNNLKLENHQLKAQIKSQETAMLKCSDPVNEDYQSFVTNPLPQHYKKQISEIPQSTIILQLKKQNKDLREELDDFKEEMIRVKRSAKLTKIQELEAELKNYSDESLRLKQLLHQQILKTMNPTKTEQNIEERILTLQEQLQKCSQAKNKFYQELKKAEEEIKNLNLQNSELDQNYQKSIKEKTQIKKQLTSLEEQFNKAQLNDPLFRRGQDVTQMKLELERKVVENNQLKNDNMIKDKKVHDLERSLKDVTSTFQDKLNTVTKEKESFKEKYEKQKQELIELQDKYQQLFFNSNRNLQSQQIQSGRRDAIFTVQSQEDIQNQRRKSQELTPDMHKQNDIQQQQQQSTQQEKQSYRRKVQRKLSSIRQDDIEELLTQLRYKLRAQNIRNAELELYLFRQKDTNETSLGEMIQILQNKPFNLNQNESVLISRYLIEPYGEKEITYNINLTKDNESILQTLIRAIGKYNILVGEDRIQMHEQIRQKLNEKKDDLMAYLKPKKQQGNSSQSISAQLPGSLVNRQQFKTALLQTSLDEEQTDVLLQTIYEQTQDFNFIDLDMVFETWPSSGPIKITRVQVEQQKEDGELPDTVRECIECLLEYANKNGLSILDLRKQIDEDNSGHVERSEMKQFLLKCDIQLNNEQYDLILDHFDLEGDGRISTNDIGVVLNKAYNQKMLAMKEQRSAKKTSKQILNLVANHFVQFMQTNKLDLFEIFMTIDQDGSGSVSRDEFKQMLRTRIVIPLDQEEYAEFFKLIDNTNDGQIHFNEFQQHMIPEIEKITQRPYHEFLNEQITKKVG